MGDSSKGEWLKALLSLAEKHPNTKLGKLIKCVESETTRKNIVLLLMELAEHPEFSCDISISLQYYLDIFESLPGEPSFSEVGLLLLSSAIIYSKRVDAVHRTVETLIFSLNNDERADTESCDPNTNETEKSIKRGKKRQLEQLTGPYEANVSIKRFKTISNSKRFDNISMNSTKKITNSLKDFQKKESVKKLSKGFIHPTIWKKSIIEAFDIDNESDSKRNYKLFTYHLEHRYNTLVPDINFKMYFKIKDFIDAECKDPELWPPLSDAYIDHCVNLENQILHKEGHNAKNQYITGKSNKHDKEIRNHTLNQSQDYHSFSDPVMNSQSISLNANSFENTCNTATLIDTSITIDESAGQTSTSDDVSEDPCLAKSTSIQSGNCSSLNDSAIECNSFVESHIRDNATVIESINEKDFPSKRLSSCDADATLLDLKCEEDDLNTIKVILPHLDDEGVFFSDLDERDHNLLSPAVVATDVFRCIKDKSNITVIVDDIIKRIYNIQEPRTVFSVPVYSCPDCPSIVLNILKIQEKYLKKRNTFKLGLEFHQLKKERQRKYCSPNQKNYLSSLKEAIEMPLFPPTSPFYEPDFHGFPESKLGDKNRTMSRDSGISLPQNDTTLDKTNHDVCQGSNNVLESTLDPKESKRLSGSEQTSCNGEITNVLEESLLSAKETSSQFPPATEETLCQTLVSENITNTIDSSKECNTNNCDPVSSSKCDHLGELPERNTVHISKVEQWHAHLQPILARSRERHHFDVFELGSEIMNQFDRHDLSSEVVSLNHVMKNRDSSLVSRYFLSTLLLASQGNISINIKSRSSDKPSALNDVELILLNKKRNVVSLEDNIGLKTSLTSIEDPMQESTCTTIRTLKSVPTVPKTQDRDSGISMSDGCSI